MNYEYYKRYEPLWDKWKIVREIGSGSYGRVFEIQCEENGVIRKAALKAVSVPKNDDELSAALQSEGMTMKEASLFFKEAADDFSEECNVMHKFSNSRNIVNYQEHITRIHDNRVGWDILIRMELLTPLFIYFMVNAVTEGIVVRLGIDICKALIECENNNILHRDIKPENIFVYKTGDFKLGDFGVAKVVESTVGASTRVGTADYSAPEVLVGYQKYDKRADLYSLGMVMYRLLNEKRMPFWPLPPNPISYRQRQEAQSKRLNGEKMSKPVNSSDELGKIILKACSFNADDRYQNAREMKKALEMLGN